MRSPNACECENETHLKQVFRVLAGSTSALAIKAAFVSTEQVEGVRIRKPSAGRRRSACWRVWRVQWRQMHLAFDLLNNQSNQSSGFWRTPHSYRFMSRNFNPVNSAESVFFTFLPAFCLKYAGSWYFPLWLFYIVNWCFFSGVMSFVLQT